jgi:CRP-like cAMP-binding protein
MFPQPGECFGELEFFTEGRRECGARSLTFSTVFMLDREEFMSILKEDPNEWVI